jgi:uncharacterized protein YecA (UPF0149 family)
MGAIAEGIMAYAQPLIDETDGSMQQLNHALTIAQVCYNLALTPEDSRHGTLAELQRTLTMEDEEFEAFWSSVIEPMIRRHEEMFPGLHGRSSPRVLQSDHWAQLQSRMAMPAEKPTVIDRYAPCPCNSGKKYKFCCGKKPR